jgi:hypothetical protein
LARSSFRKHDALASPSGEDGAVAIRAACCACQAAPFAVTGACEAQVRDSSHMAIPVHYRQRSSLNSVQEAGPFCGTVRASDCCYRALQQSSRSCEIVFLVSALRPPKSNPSEMPSVQPWVLQHALEARKRQRVEWHRHHIRIASGDHLFQLSRG